MFRSAAAAERAAIDGDGEEFDTQKCLELQRNILSSSPSFIQDDDQDRDIVNASNVNTVHERRALTEPPVVSPIHRHTGALSDHAHTHPPRHSSDSSIVKPAPPAAAPRQPPARENHAGEGPSQGQRFSTLHSKGLRWPHDADGHELPIKATAHLTRQVMSQRSNVSATSGVSLTQENAPFVYAQYERANAQSTDPPYGSDAMLPPTDVPYYGSSFVPSKPYQASPITDSTARTYGDDDTGHVDLGTFDSTTMPFGTYEGEAGTQEPVSQDASFAPRTEYQATRFFDPETPVAPINPFTRKGSVMKGHEMFGATQPSSIGRTPLSATSPRPSPVAFNPARSPKGLESSPLLRRYEGDRNENQTSPLQSSVRGLLNDRFHHSLSPESHTPLVPRTSGIRSFDGGPALQRTASLPEPQAEYISMKESQERRRNLTASIQQDSDSDSDDEDDLDLDSGPRRHLRQREKERNIQKELAAVQFNRRPRSRSGLSTKEVEVPSTEQRRRSVQEEYIAQCEGTDARDTQHDHFQPNTQDTQDTQDDDGVIADSQVVPEPQPLNAPDNSGNAISSWGEDNPNRSMPSPQLPPLVSYPAQADRVPELDSISRTREPTSDATKSPPQPSTLPLQELSGNYFRTPQPQKTAILSDEADAHIPETSPPEDHLRPMGEIATISSGVRAASEALEDVPGFTQDPDFNFNMLDSANSESPQRGAPDTATTRTIGRDPREIQSIRRSPRRVRREHHHGEMHAEAILLSSTLNDQEDVRELDVAWSEAYVNSSPLDSSEPVLPVRRNRSRNRSTANAKALEEAKIRAEERRQSKIAFRKTQIQEGTEYEPDESDEEEGVQEALDAFKKDLAEKEAVSKQKSPLPESSPDPLGNDNDHQGSPNEHTNGHGKAKRPTVEETPTITKAGLKGKNELKGPSRALRRAVDVTSVAVNGTEDSKRSEAKGMLRNIATPKSSTAPSKPASAHKSSSTRSTRRSLRIIGLAGTPDSSPLSSAPSSIPVLSSSNATERTAAGDTPVKPAKRTAKRKSTATAARDEDDLVATLNLPSRSSTRRSIAHATAGSEKKSVSKLAPRPKKMARKLFNNMAFAISYQEQEKKDFKHTIQQYGGQILHDGFECLFEMPSRTPTGTRSARLHSPEETTCSLTLSAMAQDIGFTALIASEHSRKEKYMQALALGIPCLSGRWILECVARNVVVDWSPYLLCAGQSSFLDNAMRSRTLSPYPAADASFASTFASREKLLDGKTIILVAGKGRAMEKRKAYIFLTRVLGPKRLVQVRDLAHAREKLLEAESNGEEVHCLYAENDEDGAQDAVFGFATGGGTQKRKRASIAAEDAEPAPKRIKVISDEFVIQSLILGQLVEET